jgi:hypothetical protein
MKVAADEPGTSTAMAIAPLLPGVTRRFPLFAPLPTRPEVFFRAGWVEMGRSAHDHQNHRALGVATGSRAPFVFRETLAGGGGCGRYGRGNEIGNGGGAHCAP